MAIGESCAEGAQIIARVAASEVPMLAFDAILVARAVPLEAVGSGTEARYFESLEALDVVPLSLPDA